MELSAVLGFALVAVALIAVPGPDWAYVLASGARDHVVAPAVSGILLGYVLITAVVVVGVGPLATTLPAALLVLTVVGAGYLVYLGICTLRRPAGVGSACPAASQGRTPLRYVARGVGVSALNPKGLLLFLSILPQCERPEAAWPLPAQLATLGAVFIVICAAFYLPLGHAADRVLGARPGVARAVSKVAGCAMIVVGLGLLAERLVLALWR